MVSLTNRNGDLTIEVDGVLQDLIVQISDVLLAFCDEIASGDEIRGKAVGAALLGLTAHSLGIELEIKDVKLEEK